MNELNAEKTGSRRVNDSGAHRENYPWGEG